MKICVFSGTSEGRELCAFLSEHKIKADEYVATGYGLQRFEGITPHIGRLEYRQMKREFKDGALVIDASHPYAANVTDNLRRACTETGSEYLRLLRPGVLSGEYEAVPDTGSAAAWLNSNEGKVLLTTGSKELDKFTIVKNYRERIYARVLPVSGVLEKCEKLGFEGKHIIAMQGPFSHEMNVATLKDTGADILVTKDSGGPGGVADKLSAAKEVGAKVLVISRPSEESGKSLYEIKAILSERFGIEPKRRFPLFVQIYGKKCMIFGAGKIAERRAGILRRFGADVKVIAPESRSGLEIDEKRCYIESDLDGVFLVVAATDSREANLKIGEDCAARGILCSVSDSAYESGFFFPAICEGGGLTAGIVSGGKDHKKTAEAAKRIREVLEEEYGTD